MERYPESPYRIASVLLLGRQWKTALANILPQQLLAWGSRTAQGTNLCRGGNNPLAQPWGGAEMLLGFRFALRSRAGSSSRTRAGAARGGSASGGTSCKQGHGGAPGTVLAYQTAQGRFYFKPKLPC